MPSRTIDPMHVTFRRMLSDQATSPVSWIRAWMEMELDLLHWGLQEEIAATIGTWPTSDVRAVLEQSDPLRLRWIEAVLLAFWLGKDPEECGTPPPPQEIRALADRFLVRSVEWELHVPALLEAMNAPGDSP